MYCPPMPSSIFQPTVYVKSLIELPSADICRRFLFHNESKRRISEVKTNLFGNNKSPLVVINWEQ